MDFPLIREVEPACRRPSPSKGSRNGSSASRIRKTETSLLIEINEFGQQGWELVSVIYYKDPKGTMSWIAFMKRPATGQAPPAQAQDAAATIQPSARIDGPAAGAAGFDLADDEFKLAE